MNDIETVRSHTACDYVIDVPTILGTTVLVGSIRGSSNIKRRVRLEIYSTFFHGVSVIDYLFPSQSRKCSVHVCRFMHTSDSNIPGIIAYGLIFT